MTENLERAVVGAPAYVIMRRTIIVDRNDIRHGVTFHCGRVTGILPNLAILHGKDLLELEDGQGYSYGINPPRSESFGPGSVGAARADVDYNTDKLAWTFTKHKKQIRATLGGYAPYWAKWITDSAFRRYLRGAEELEGKV